MKLLQSVSLILSLFLATGCFELEEDITLNKNGSGSYKQVVNLTEAMSMMAMLESNDTSKKNESATTSMLKWEQIKLVKGIRNLRIDSVNYVYTWSFDFDNMQSLNAAISSVLSTPEKTVDYYSFDGSTFKKNFTGFESISDEYDEDTEMMISLMKDAPFVLKVAFADNIRSINQKKAGKKGKSFSINTTLEEVVKNNSLLLEIKLK